MRHFKRFAVAMLVVAMILSTAGFAGATAPDVVGTRFEESVDYLTGLGVVAGYPDGTYKPGATITRAEAAKIIVVMKYGSADLADLLKGAAPFSDVPGTHWASGFIALAKNAGILNGYPDGTFKPEAPVTYAEFAKMLVEAAGLEPVAGLTWPANYVSAALNAGILTDVPDFESNAPATRGDCAIMAAFTVAEVEDPATGKTLAESVFGESAVATVTLTPATELVGVGDGVALAAVAKDADGNVIADATFTWTTSDPAKSAVNTTGYFVGSASGVYTVTATSGGVAGTAEVSVYGAAAALKAEASATTVPANGSTEVEITVSVVDANGIVVADDDETILNMDYDDEGENGAVEMLDGGDPTDQELTVENGVAVFVVTAGTNADVTDILLFWDEDEDLDEETVEIAAVDQVATSIELEADPEELMANEEDFGEVTATVLDQNGEPMISGVFELTFSIDGKGFLDGDTDDVAVATIGQEVTVPVSSDKGDPGSFTITATGEGLTSASVTVNTYVAGSPVALQVTVDEDTAEAGVEDLEITVTIVDKWGHPTIDEDGDVELTADEDDGTWLPSFDDNWLIPQGDPRATFTWGGEEAGTFAVTLTDDNDDLTATAFEVTVTPSDPFEIELTPDLAEGDMYLHLNTPTMVFSVQVVDQFGNDVPKAGIPILFEATEEVANTGDAEFTNDGEVKTDATGKATVTFTADPYDEDAWDIMATACFDDDDVYDDSPVATANQVVISDTVPGSLTITTKNGVDENISSILADDGEWVYLTIELKDTNGTVMDDMDGYVIEVEFSNDGEHVQLVADTDADNGMVDEGDGVYTLYTVGGVVDLEFEGYRAGSFTIKATALQANGEIAKTKTFRTKVGTVVEGVAVFLTDGTLADDVDYDDDEVLTLRVSPVDNGDNVIAAPDDIPIITTLGVLPTAEYRTSASGSEVTATTIAAGKTYKTVYYVDAADGDGEDLTDDWEID